MQNRRNRTSTDFLREIARAPDRKKLAMSKPVFLIILGLLGVALQNAGRIESVVFGEPQYSRVGNKVVLYATEWCGYCRKTRELFRKNNISYVEYDIEKSEKGLREYKRLGGNGVPLLQINGKVIHGYNEKAILASLNPD